MLYNRKHPAIRLFALSFLELWRNKYGLILLITIPVIFLAVVEWTSGEEVIPIELYYQDEIRQVLLTQREVNLVFIGAAVLGFLAAYYAIVLFHKNFEYYKYCISMGLSRVSFLAARCFFFLGLIVTLAMLISVSLWFTIDIRQIFGLLLGFILMGVIYGTIGGIFGLISRDYMVAMLAMVLLANLDAGWLQNPVFYSSAQETEVIKWLPAFFPTQLVFASAFTENWNIWATGMSLFISIFLFTMIISIVYIKTRDVQKWKD